jgi:chondroitin AC lyase
MDPPPFKTTRVPTDFVGGIAAGDSGLAVLDYARDGLKAHKAWFFSPEGVICLGAGISGVAEARVTTTLNQCLLNGPVTFHAVRSTTTVPGGTERTLRSPDWIEHDGWRYTILDHASVQVSTLQVLGSWSKVFRNPETPITPVSGDIFLASIDHSANPSNASYAYAASPAGASPAVKVLANTALVQAVTLPGGATGIVFWTAGEFSVPGGPWVKAGSPCVIWIQSGAVLVCDPTQQLHELALSVGATTRIVKLPEGMMAGTAVTL